MALNRLAECFYITMQDDSTLLYENKAWHYAQASKDSAIIARVAFDLSTDYNYWGNQDSALTYTRIALQWIPENDEESRYYAGLADIFIEMGEKDSALYYISQGLKDSTNTYLRGELLYSLALLKQEKADFEDANQLLLQYIEIAGSLNTLDRSTEIQQLIHKYDIQKKVREEQVRGQNRLLLSSVGFIIIVLLLLLYSQHRVNKRKRAQLLNAQRLKQTQEKLASLQSSIEESQRIVSLLQNNLVEEKEKNLQEIREREVSIEKLKKEKTALRSWLFRQSTIYNKVEKLARQEVSNKRELKVLTDAEQKKLKGVVQEVYADCIAEWKSKYPRLSEEDLLYLCLEEAGLKQTAIALCFGNVDTHALAQRRYRMKERMKPEENGGCDN